MPKMTSSEIVQSIRNFVGNSSDSIRSHWYVGITEDIESRLFGDHNVYKNNRNGYTYYEAISERDARGAEAELLGLGYDGGTGGGNAPTYVYVFHKENYTDPKA